MQSKTGSSTEQTFYKYKCYPYGENIGNHEKRLENKEMNDMEILNKIEDRISNLELKVESLEESRKDGHSFQFLRDQVKDDSKNCGGKMQILQEKELQLKLNLEVKIDKMDKDIEDRNKNSKIKKQAYEQQITENLNKLEENMKEEYHRLATQKKMVHKGLRKRMDSIGLELKKTAISQKQTNTKIFHKIERMKQKLNKQIEGEEKRRKDYSEIIYNLLQKTCLQAEHSIRRKVY